MRTVFTITMAFFLSACAGLPHPGGKPIAYQTYEHLEPLHLRAAEVSIIQLYDASVNPEDMSGQLVVPPQEALADYAQNRFMATGGVDTFRFVIEEARVTQRVLEDTRAFLRWTGLTNRDEYRFTVRVGLYRVSPGAHSGPGVVIAMKRTLTLAESTSIAEREEKLSAFVYEMVSDLDVRAQDVLIQTMRF